MINRKKEHTFKTKARIQKKNKKKGEKAKETEGTGVEEGGKREEGGESVCVHVCVVRA